jgi:hypothetical protein
MTSPILSEHVAFIATRAEWARIGKLLGSIPPCNSRLQDNLAFLESLHRLANNDADICITYDAISVINIDTQLRIERNVPVVTDKVKIVKSENVMRSAWEPRNEATQSD